MIDGTAFLLVCPEWAKKPRILYWLLREALRPIDRGLRARCLSLPFLTPKGIGCQYRKRVCWLLTLGIDPFKNRNFLDKKFNPYNTTIMRTDFQQNREQFCMTPWYANPLEFAQRRHSARHT
jgi:hypothetical protein